jgi:hypothetical protein
LKIDFQSKSGLVRQGILANTFKPKRFKNIRIPSSGICLRVSRCLTSQARTSRKSQKRRVRGQRVRGQRVRGQRSETPLRTEMRAPVSPVPVRLGSGQKPKALWLPRKVGTTGMSENFLALLEEARRLPVNERRELAARRREALSETSASEARRQAALAIVEETFGSIKVSTETVDSARRGRRILWILGGRWQAFEGLQDGPHPVALGVPTPISPSLPGSSVAARSYYNLAA